MPRHRRKKSEFNTYHIIQRGNERRNIFLSDEDKVRFIETLSRMKERYNFLIYTYCLMDNHYHLIIYDNGNDISQLMKSINTSYAIYFNRIYKRCGHLFQDRFKSELIGDDKYLLEVSKYIHNNPVKARMADSPEEYKWSSYNLYTGMIKDGSKLLDTGKVLGIISNKRDVAIKEYIKFVTQKEEADLRILDVEDEIDISRDHNTDFIYTKSQAEKRIREIVANRNLTYEVIMKDKKYRYELIKQIRANSSLTLKQIGEIFFISESRVSKILKGKLKKERQEPSPLAIAMIFFIFCVYLLQIGNILSANPPSSSKNEAPAIHFQWNKANFNQYSLPKQIRYTLSVQNLENKRGKDLKLWLYAPTNITSHQILKNLKISYPAKVTQDTQGNTICEFSIPEILPYETKIFRLWADLGTSDTPQKITIDNPDTYLQPERLIESDHTSIQRKAQNLKKDDPYETAKSIYQWVSDNIKTNTLLTEDKGALYAIENLEGDCTECATLFVALCRAAGIPARMLSGYICERNCIVTAIDFHNWAEFYHEDVWYIVDPHNKRFDKEGEKYIVTEIYQGDNQNPVGQYHRYRFEGKGVRFKVKMTD